MWCGASGHVPLAVGVVFGGDAGGAEGEVAGGADAAGAVEPLVLEELADAADGGARMRYQRFKVGVSLLFALAAC